MKSVGKKLILLSFFLALIATITVFVYLQSLNTNKGAVKKITILVAKETIAPRSIIESKMLKETQVPDDSIFNEYIMDSSKIIGKYTKDAVMKNEGFRSENLISKNSDEISLMIGSNNRAISINVTGASAVSDLLKSGDHVDIVVSLPEKKEGNVTVMPQSSKILLRNIQVLAVDKTINREDTTKAKTDIQQKVPPTFLVTLDVALLDIEKLVLAEDIGSLKLVLRPLAKEANVDTKGAVWQDLTTPISDSNKDGAIVKDNALVSPVSEPLDKVISYTIKRGDNLKSISLTFYGDKEKFYLIKEANNIQNENLILVGEVIKIPTTK